MHVDQIFFPMWITRAEKICETQNVIHIKGTRIVFGVAAYNFSYTFQIQNNDKNQNTSNDNKEKEKKILKAM